MTINRGTAAIGRWLADRGPWPIFPHLFGLYPILYLLAENLYELPVVQALRSLLVVQAMVVALVLLIGTFVGSFRRAGLLTAAIVLVLLSYGHVYSPLEQIHLLGLQLGRHRHLIPASLALLLFWGYVVIRRIDKLKPATQAATAMAAVLLALPAFSLGRGAIRQLAPWTGSGERMPLAQAASNPETLPDIYYIILDGYARGDVMAGKHGFDNQPFLDQLDSWGFVVADRSHANHMWTALSLSSSLNMEFAFDLGLKLSEGTYPGIFVEPIRDNQVRRLLESVGYQTVAFRSGYLPTEMTDADQYLAPPDVSNESGESGLALNRFENLLFYASGGLVIADWLGPRLYDWVGFRSSYPYDELRQIILYEFDQLPMVAEMPGPQFVFVHVVAPHSPYLFGPNGERLEREGEFSLLEDGQSSSQSVLYRDQARYITTLTEQALADILQASERQPVILLQSDHGPGLSEQWNVPNSDTVWQRTAILNAYLLPRACREGVYDSITPVNSFRLVLDCLFDLDLEAKPDTVYFSYWPRRSPYEFIDITDHVERMELRGP